MTRRVLIGDSLRCETAVIDQRETRSRLNAGLMVFEHRAPHQRRRTAMLHRNVH